MQTLIYEYGVRLDKECLPEVNRQFWLAHTLYNNIVATIRSIREEANTLLISSTPELAAINTKIEQSSKAFAEAKVRNDEEGMKAAAEQRRVFRRRFAELSGPARKALRNELAEIYARIGMRSECDTYKLLAPALADGLGRPTADMIHTTALNAWKKVCKDGGQINFRKAAERQSDHIDFRFTDAGGVPAEELLTGRHRSISFAEPPHYADRPNAKPYPGFRFRIGAAKADTFATGSIQLHRPFPEGSRVTTCRLVRRRIGPDTRWSIQLQLSVPQDQTITVPAKRRPLAAAHFGWSLSDEGLRRIAAIAYEADPGCVQFLDLPYDIQEDFARAELLQQERDENRDRMAELIKGDVSTTGWCDDEKAELAALRRLPVQHIAAKRLSRLSWMLAESGNDWQALTEYAIEDRWMWQAQRHIDTRARNRRRHFYRHVALEWVRAYETIVVCSPNLSESALRIKDNGERNELGQLARKARHNAAISEFMQALSWAATRAGTIILQSTDASHVHRCAQCGETVVRDGDYIRCSCGHEDDSKANSANVLWQQNLETFAQEAQGAKAAILKVKQAADEKKAEKLVKMFTKRAEVRADMSKSVECVA